uniref:AlNc14C598G12220 protein n=1 Tax=Albugo laibachii Nc14 TaxID=890382 RepID=F0X1C8_9STRA|nr:AlNc14C598G12220 [Albugo laibachii Nc14]|eukprot:CCA27605.1 AlNc14C598G12220 [Albugo laibachii Nc14]
MSPGSYRGCHASENASVFRETLKNYGPLGQRMTVNDLSGDYGIENGGAMRAATGRTQQDYPRQAQDQGMARDFLPQGHPVMNPFGPLGGVKIPRLSIQNFNGAEMYVGLGSGFKQWSSLFIDAIEVAELSSDVLGLNV